MSNSEMINKRVLCIEKIDETNEISPIDTRMFIFWHETERIYLVRGMRQHLPPEPFNLSCDSTHDLSEIIGFMVGKNKINAILYNFINIYYNINNISDKYCNELSYDIFERVMDKQWEISRYNNMSYKRKDMVKYLRMLKKSHQSYETNENENEEETK
jgi:hypothetical protein